MTISEVCKQFEINQTALRYYEKAGLMEPVEKDASGHRFYQEKDIRRINFIMCMRKAGLGIEMIKQYVELFNEGEHTIPDRKEILIKQRQMIKEQIDELQNVHDYLNHKIENYENTLMKRELEQRHKNTSQ